MAFDNESNHLALGTAKGNLLLLSMEHLAYTKFNQKSNSKVNFLKFSPFYGNYVGCAYDDGAVKVFDVGENSLLHEFGNHEASCSAIAFSPINKLLFCSAGLDGKINFFDVQAKK